MTTDAPALRHGALLWSGLAAASALGALGSLAFMLVVSFFLFRVIEGDPIGNLFRDHPREAFLVMALTAGGTAAFYAYTIYLQKFLVNTSGFDRTTASRIMTVALALMMLIQPFAGRLSDHIGRKPLMVAFGALGTLLTYPIFTTLERMHDPLSAFAVDDRRGRRGGAGGGEQGRRDGGALLGQRPLAGQQGAQVQGLVIEPRIAVIGQAFEVSREIALILHRQQEVHDRFVSDLDALRFGC